jgi:hypothetical protein
MTTYVGSVSHRHKTTLPNKPSSDVSATIWNDSEVVSGPMVASVPSPVPAPNVATAMVLDTGKTDGWAFAMMPMRFGGSRTVSVPLVAAPQNCVDWVDISLDGGPVDSAYSVSVDVEVRTAAIGTSVTPQIYNVTTATVVVTGAACIAALLDYSGANQFQTLTWSLKSGVNKYRLRLTPANVLNPVYGISGYLRLT